MNLNSSLMGKFCGKRTLKISLRTLHLIGIAGVGGGILLSQPMTYWQWYWYLALFSGTAMLLLEITSNFIWCVQIRGLAIYLKLGLLVFLGTYPHWDKVIIIAIIIISGIISHASGNLRYYSVWHRKRIDSINDIKG